MNVYAPSLPNSAIDAIIRTAGPTVFSNWLFDVTPDWQWNAPHLVLIRRQLAAVTDGRISRLMLFLPPRHGKSEMTTVRYAAWRLQRDPAKRVIIGAYNQTLANKFSRKVRRIAEAQGVPIDPARTAVDDWETLAGGGVRAAGVGAGVTGMGGDLIIIDDPVKNREEANSLTYREKVWAWYTDDLYTRLEPGGSIILIMTRWHEDDLAGRLLTSDDAQNWHVVNLPALAEANDALGRHPGAALWPERYNEAELASIRQAIGGRAFASLYQQRPVEQEGGMFRRSWFKFTDKPPAMAAATRYWDMGATAGGGDPTTGVKMGRGVDGLYYVLDVRRGQWATNARDDVIQQTGIQDGTAITQWIEEEPGSAGKDRMAYLVRRLAGLPVRGDRPTGSKETRAEPYAAQVEAGNVVLARGAWNAAYIDELCMFPNGAHDDQVDASSGAFGKLTRGGIEAGQARY